MSSREGRVLIPILPPPWYTHHCWPCPCVQHNASRPCVLLIVSRENVERCRTTSAPHTRVYRYTRNVETSVVLPERRVKRSADEEGYVVAAVVSGIFCTRTRDLSRAEECVPAVFFARQHAYTPTRHPRVKVRVYTQLCAIGALESDGFTVTAAKGVHVKHDNQSIETSLNTRSVHHDRRAFCNFHRQSALTDKNVETTMTFCRDEPMRFLVQLVGLFMRAVSQLCAFRLDRHSTFI